jgi:four helix bundle protein
METNTHLRVLDDVFTLIRRLRPVVGRLKKESRSLADQLERAANSIALNLSEGNAVKNGNRKARFENALGSAKETRTAVKLAGAWGYIPDAVAEELDAKLDSIAAQLYCLTYR